MLRRLKRHYLLVVLGFELRASDLLVMLSTTLTPICFSYFSNVVSHFCLGQPAPWCFCLCVLHSCDDRCTLRCQFIGQDRVSLTFCLSWFQIVILPISASQVAGITDVTHYKRHFINCVFKLCTFVIIFSTSSTSSIFFICKNMDL
jgi:hypothetical protein